MMTIDVLVDLAFRTNYIEVLDIAVLCCRPFQACEQRPRILGTFPDTSVISVVCRFLVLAVSTDQLVLDPRTSYFWFTPLIFLRSHDVRYCLFHRVPAVQIASGA